MQHEVLAVLAVERVDDLLVLAGAERGGRQRLRLAAGEQRRAVGARQHAHLGADRPHRLGVAAVDAATGLQDRAAHDLRFQLLEDAGRDRRLGRNVGDDGQRLLLHGADLLVARLLDRLGVGRLQLVPHGRLELRGD